MQDLVTTAVDAFTAFLSGVGNGVTSLFSTLLYQGTGAERVISDFAIYTMAILGLSLGVGLLYKLIGMIRSRG